MDDLSQYFKTFSTHPGCRIVLDSCSDVTTDLARELGVDIIEFPYVMEDGNHWDDQYASMTPEEFYGRMAAGERMFTSAVPMGHFVSIFEQCARDGIPTLYLSFTAGLSSSVHDAQRAAEFIVGRHPGFDLVVMDNRSPSLTAVLLAEGACRLRDTGAPMREVAAWCDKNASRIHGYFTLQSLDRLVAGGRVPKAAASLSSVLDVKANLSFDDAGALCLTGISRGRKKALKAIVKELRASYEGSPDLPIGIVQAACPADAEALAELVRAELGEQCPRIVIAPLDPTVGAHVGPGMIGCTFWGTDRRAAR